MPHHGIRDRIKDRISREWLGQKPHHALFEGEIWRNVLTSRKNDRRRGKAVTHFGDEPVAVAPRHVAVNKNGADTGCFENLDCNIGTGCHVYDVLGSSKHAGQHFADWFLVVHDEY